ncbi:MAG: polyprenyl synthetase family protein [Deltaproteobacteria bacterium]|jgi:geranylgeranyl pyrophosphate synthase|nr:polyprenyl synthetase family protein [Deltaproteobacteria bacterium]
MITAQQPDSLKSDIISEIYDYALPIVDNKIISCFASSSPTIFEITNYLFKIGGKRFRPLLILLSARLFGMQTPSDKIIIACASIELIHMATLLHDDIIDKSATRRGHESAYKKFGLPASLLAGDFLLVRAFGLSCYTLDEKLIKYTEKACLSLTEGEELEGTITGDKWKSYEEYLDIIQKKTASLFSLACATGAYFAGATEEQTKILEQFGQLLGTAFQIIDDILDILADEKDFGKPLGTDLKQRTPSIVNILWLESGDLRAKEFFNCEQPQTMQMIEETILYLRNSNIVIRAKEIANQFAELAKTELDKLDEGIDFEVKQEFLRLLDKTLNRCA